MAMRLDPGSCSDERQGTLSTTEDEPGIAPFERLLIHISTRLAGARRDEVGPAVNQALAELLGFYGVARASIFEVLPDGSQARLRHVASLPGVPSSPQDELPPLAASAGVSTRALDAGSVLHIPLELDAEVRFVLALLTKRGVPEWTEHGITRLKALGELFVQALSRADAFAALLASQHDTHEALEVMHLGRWEWDPSADRLHLSDEAKHILGTEISRVSQLLDRVEQPDRIELERTIERARAQPGQRFDTRYAIRAPRGERRIIQQWHELRLSDDGTMQLVATVQDVTAMVKAEQELLELRVHHWHSARVAQTSLLVASLAHELCQPLTAILNNAQAGLRFLRNENLSPEEMRDILSDIVASNKRASEVLGALRAMLRRKHTTRVIFNAADAVHDVLALVRSELMTEQIELETSLAPGCYLNADKTQIEQVVLNLVMNSIDAMRGQRDVERRLQLTVSENDAREVQVSVLDWGRGIPPSKIRKVFDAFWTTKQKGLGMGLSVCQAIVESWGGRIWCENNAAGGATFHFTLPSAERLEQAAAAAGVSACLSG